MTRLRRALAGTALAASATAAAMPALAQEAVAQQALAQQAAKAKPARDPHELKRPKMAAGADINDAIAYNTFGVAMLSDRPDEAERAFYWATRIMPSWSQPYYGRWAALQIMASERRIISDGDRAIADSMEHAASMREPFLYRALDPVVFDAMVARNFTPLEGFYLNAWRNRSVSNPIYAASKAYDDGRFADAARLYAGAIRVYGKYAGLHENRAMAFYQLQAYDSAMAEVRAYVEAARTRDDTVLTRMYRSKAFYEHQIGVLLEMRGDTAAARAAFGRALVEDLTFHPSHVALYDLAVAAHDLPGALAEAQAAVQSADADPVLHYDYAHALLAVGRPEDAEKELRRAITLEPYYAMPYYLLGRLYDRAGMSEDAGEQYAAFIAHASRNLDEYTWTTARLAALRTPAASGGTR